jgi:hypothetical protein
MAPECAPHCYNSIKAITSDPNSHLMCPALKWIFKNFLDACVNFVILPIAQKLMLPSQTARASGGAYLAGALILINARDRCSNSARFRELGRKATRHQRTIEATRSRARAEAILAKYDTMLAELAAALKVTKDIPVDVEPVFSFKE